MIVSLYKGKRERNECTNYKSISLLIVLGKIHSGILVDRVHRENEGLSYDKKGGFREGSGCVDQIFTLKQIGEKIREKKRSVCGLYGFGEGI